jgi:hypothetical protein
VHQENKNATPLKIIEAYAAVGGKNKIVYTPNGDWQQGSGQR